MRKLLCVWLAASLACRTTVPVAVSIPATPTSPPPSVPAPAPGRPTVAIVDEEAGSITIRSGDTHPATAAGAATALPAAEATALLARLPPMPAVATGSAAPTVRPASAPPPRPGAVSPIAFVAARGKPVGDGPIAPVTMSRAMVPPTISPQQEVSAESEVRVRFTEAMVPVAAVGSSPIPKVTIAPPVAGTWRWVDTHLLQFTAASRFPAATTFTVTVATGARAASGATLTADTSVEFRTPALSIRGTVPSEVRPDGPIAVLFDQDFDPEQIAKKLRVEIGSRGGKGKPAAFRVIDDAEAQRLWARNPRSSDRVDALLLGRHRIILAPATAWPAGTSALVSLATGAPSREGPRVSERETTGRVDVVPAFEVEGIACNDKDARMVAACPANGYMRVEVSNEIDTRLYKPQQIQIAGEPLMDNTPSYRGVALTTPRTVGKRFDIAIDPELVDIYGQKLDDARRPSLTTTPEVWEPFLAAARADMYVLDPRYEVPQWVLEIQGIASVRVQLFAVQPKDYFAYQRWYEAGAAGVPPGARMFDRSYDIGTGNGADLRVDLRPALRSGTGHVVAVATGSASRPGDAQRAAAWIQVTKLGMTARADGEHVHAWLHDITPARQLAPIAGVVPAILTEGKTGATGAPTDADGHAIFDLPATTKRQSQLVVASTAGDATFAVVNGFEKTVRLESARWYVTDDRFTYKPGETVYVKGWVRWTHNGINPDIATPAPNSPVDYELADGRGNRIAKGTATTTDQGGFDFEVALPPNANLGTAWFTLRTRHESFRHPIDILEFRTPTYAVAMADDVGFSGAKPLILGESVEMATTARYYAGGGLGGAQVAWSATLTPTTYRPPGWESYVFSPPRPRSQQGYYADDRHVKSISAKLENALGGESSAAIELGIAALPQHRPSLLEVDATVADLDRAHIRASSHPIVVHPSAYYVGLRLRPNADTLEAVVTDIDGAVVAGVPIEITVEGVLGSLRYRDDATPVDTQTCKLTSASAPATCNFTRKDIQTAYIATARVADPRGRTNAAQYAIPWSVYDAKEDLAIVPDKTLYRPGDVAHLEIRSTVVPATAVVTFARQGVIAQQRIEMTAKTAKIDLPIEAAYTQNVFVLVDRWAKRRSVAVEGSGPLPEHTSTQIDLPVDLEASRLAMTARPRKPMVGPGEQATFDVEVRRDDKPVPGAEVALMVVDEAVLALSSHRFGDPLSAFYGHLGDGTVQASTMSLVDDAGEALAGNPGFRKYKLDELTRRHGTGSGFGYGRAGFGPGGGGAGMRSTVEARKDFRPNAVFAPRLVTDAAGKATVTVKMPDGLTRYRVVALATAANRNFGKAEGSIVVQRKLNARTVAPRFLSQGDRFWLPVIVQNLDAAPRTVDVAVRAANLTSLGAAGARITIPAGQRGEVRFELATAARGKAAIQTIAVSGDFADASTVELPVYEPATTESFATYGSLEDKPAFEQLAVPADVFPDVGGVEVELASTQLQALTDAYWYLYAYPYQCAEQRSARMLATTAVYDILDAFDAPGRPTRAELADTLANDVQVLAQTQMPDGGWGYFRGMKSDPFVTMQVHAALATQPSAPAKTLAAARKRITATLDEAFAQLGASRRAPRDELAAIVATAATALSSLAAGKVDVTARAEQLHALATSLDAYPIDAAARLLAIAKAKPIRDALAIRIASAAHETAAAATIATAYVDRERLLLPSSTRTTALALDALLRHAPDHPLVPKLARGLLDARIRGRWSTTQDNLAVLAALRRYFDVFEKTTPSYTAKLWLGTAAYTEATFAGRSSVRAEAHLGWTALRPGSTHDLAVTRDGAGRLYYRIGITYAPSRSDVPALDAGFVVRRAYTGLDDPKDVTRGADGTYHVKLGARVLVTVETTTTTPRHGVAVVDPLPAGFEAIDERLAISERTGVTAGNWEHVQMRDNRSEAFAMDLAPDAHRFTYAVRATTPGTFRAAPAKAEEMYSPETFGRSTGELVIVE